MKAVHAFIFLIIGVLTLNLVDVDGQKSSSEILAEYCQYKKSLDPNYVCADVPKSTSSGLESKKYLESNPVQKTNQFTNNEKPQNDSTTSVNGGIIFVIILVIIIIVVAAVLKGRKEYTMPSHIQQGLNTNFRNWDSRRFEELIADAYRRMGYRTSLTSNGPDQGIDVIAQNGREKIVIQAKCWQNKVSNTDVLKTIGAREMVGATKAVVVTNSEFTRSALEVLQKTPGLELISKEQLREIIKRAYKQ